MTKCEYCNKEMLDPHTTTCVLNHVRIQEVIYKRVPYYNEYRPEPHQCHDCGVQLGGVHHFGCDMEDCPKCHEQMFICECNEALEILK